MKRLNNSDVVRTNFSLSTPHEMKDSFEHLRSQYSSLTDEHMAKELRAVLSYGQLTPDTEDLLICLLQRHYTPKPEPDIGYSGMTGNCPLDFIPMACASGAPKILFVKRDPLQQLIRVYWTSDINDDRNIYIARFDGNLKPCFAKEEGDSPNGPPQISKEDLAALMYSEILEVYPNFVPPVVKETDSDIDGPGNWSVQLDISNETSRADEELLLALKKILPHDLSIRLVNKFLEHPSAKGVHSHEWRKTNHLCIFGNPLAIIGIQWGDLINPARS